MKKATFFGAILSIALLMLGGEASSAATLFLDLEAPGIQSTRTPTLCGSPTGVVTEQNPGGKRAPVTLQGTSVTLAVLWLIAAIMLTLPGAGHRRGAMDAAKRISRRWTFLAHALISPLGFATADSNADLDGDAMVTSQDISKLASCFGQNPLSNSDCAKADVDEDGDIDGDDFSFVSARLGEAYPGTLYPAPAFRTGLEPVSVTTGDVNGDEVLDAVVANRSSDDISVLLGNGDGTFQAQRRFAVGDGPGSLALGDINGDGALDVVVANGISGDISALLGNGDGGFQAQQRFGVGDNPRSVALGDVNGDDLPDAVIANEGSDDISVLLGNGDGGFQAQRRFVVGSAAYSVALGDLNNDDLLDVVVANRGSGDISVLLGNGDGSFQVQQRIDVGDVPRSVVLGYLNGDDLLDVVVVNRMSHDIWVLLGNGDGTFQTQQRYIFSDRPLSAVLGDLNDDGVLDVVVSRESHDIFVFLGSSDGTFQMQQLVTARNEQNSVALGDINKDGALDVVVAYGSNNDISVLPGIGDGRFQTSQAIASGVVLWGPTSLADLNRDGITDMVVAQGMDTVQIRAVLGNSDGNFQQSWEHSVLVGFHGWARATLSDLNRDGVLDMLLSNSQDPYHGCLLVHLGTGNGSFQQESVDGVCGTKPISLVDVNGDGTKDVVTYEYVTLSNGDGTFQESMDVAALTAIEWWFGYRDFGDVNGDGVQDVVGTGHDGNLLVLLGNGDGSFQEQRPTGINLSSPILDDVNGDGAVDVVGLRNGNLVILFSNGDGTFREQQYHYPVSSITLADLNGDSVLDIMDYGNGITIMLGNGDGTFQEQQHFSTGINLSSITLGDVNGDGTVDVVASEGDSFMILLGNGDGSFQEKQRFAYPASSVMLADLNGDGMLDVVLFHYYEMYGTVSVLFNRNGNNN